MPDLDKTPKKQLVSVVRQLQKLRGLPVGAITTLTRVQNAQLQATIEELCGDDYVVDDAARAVPVEPAAKEPRPAARQRRQPATAKREPRAALAREQKELRPLPAPEAVITVVLEGNPKRPGSASHARYAMLRSGMTVADYLAAAGSRGRRKLRKALRQGHVRVDAPN
jgi:hypothetical protein